MLTTLSVKKCLAGRRECGNTDEGQRLLAIGGPPRLGPLEHQLKVVKSGLREQIVNLLACRIGRLARLAMLFLLLHLVAGLLAGAFFRVQFLIALVLLVLIEVTLGLGRSGFALLALWCFAAETMLQLGYLFGVFARSAFERSDLVFRLMNGPSTR